MYQYGVSIFVGLDDYPQNKNMEYLQKAHELGCKTIFSSAHINEATQAKQDLEELVLQASKLGMNVSLDVSKPMMKNFEIPKGLYALRLDYGFTMDEIVELSNNGEYLIELNASTINKAYLEELVKKGLNLEKTRASFNYYPKLYTAHDISFCEEMIKEYRKYNISVLGFLPSKTGFRPPLYQGLPSIENHRYIDLDLSIEEMKAIGFDEIAFGDAYASYEEIEKLKIHQTEEILLYMNKVPNCPNQCLELLNNTFRIRPDLNSYMIRMTTHRGKVDINQFNTKERNYLDVTVDNSLFKRYRGEICIILQNLPSDERVNVIGKLHTTDFLIEKIKENKPFKIIPIN